MALDELKTVSIATKKALAAIKFEADRVALEVTGSGTDHWWTEGSGSSVTRSFTVVLSSYPAEATAASEEGES
jgi:hypothetical protein